MISNVLASFVIGVAAAAVALPAAARWIEPVAPPRPAQEQPPSQADMMKMMQEAMAKWCTPGAPHQKLEAFVGQWDAETKITVGPGMPPMTSKSKAEFKWLMPGRWLVQESKGELMGMPFHGFGLMGYDNFKQAYMATWVDNQNTYKLDMQGKPDQAGTTLIFYGTMDEYLTGENDKMVKYIWRIQAPDRLVFEVHDLAIGETNTKVVEVTYVRAR